MARKRGRPQIALPPAKAPTLDPEGAPDGPKRTPISFADAYNGREAYKVEKILAQVTCKGVEHYILKLLIRSPYAANRRATVQPRKSIVWNYFSKKFRGEDGYLYITCSLCRTTMAFCNTTNLINHLIRKHSDDLVDDAMGGKIALKAIFKKDAGGFNKPAPVAEAVKLTKLPDDVKRDYDAAAVKWIVKRCMPHSITERDQYLREFPKEEIEDLQKERLSVSLAADIWGENGISILAIMAYWITPYFELKEKLLLAKPFSQVEHNGKQIAAAAKAALAGMGIGKYSEATDTQVDVDTVGDEAFGICIDEGSNMVKAFEDFEGDSSVDHRLSNGLKDALKPPVVADIVRKMKGISAHFNRSSKGWRKLEEVAAQQRVKLFGSLHAAMDEDATAVALVDGEVLHLKVDAYNYLRGAYKDDWAPPAPSITRAPVAPASKRTAFNAAPVKKAKLSGVERLFSAAGRMHNDFKKSTSETTLEHALIVYKNLD
eukprot:jgi/Tetstr1/422837/TSEL_013628.t1